MITKQVDVAIIGAGTAGMGAYRAAREHTDSILLIEGDQYGTTCARVGCMPSKLLIAAAEAAHHHRHSDLFGVASNEPEIDGRKVMQRVRSERDRFVGFVKESVAGFKEEHKVMGYAQFTGPNTLKVGEDLLVEAKRIVIATGSRPNIPGFLHGAGNRLIVNDDVFDWDDLPTSVAVFGPGVIGLELGQALSRLGVDVRMFGVGGAIGPIKDPEIRDYAEKVINREFYLDPDAKVESLERTEKGVEITYQHREKGLITETFDYVLAATGRRPNVDNIGIENAGIRLDERGVPVFDRYTLQTRSSTEDGNSVPGHIFMAGDANNDLPLLHEAADEGRIAGANAGRFPDVRSGKRRTALGVVFSDPQIANIGLSILEVQERCRSCYATGHVSFEDQGRSRVMGKNVGLLKVYGEQGTGLFLGAEMIGPGAEHIAHLLSWVAQRRLTVSEILELPFYHPVIEEGVRTALRDLNSNLQLGPAVIERCMDCGPGA
ncbi:dihydrolipoyl dehydrogenase [Hahella ganghwensis]|uniref:dihydrolipoyl dehydrogenase n=1 Tax=Hahella ganghwensis TaxID=286420 RepID=UPI00036934DC|nr:dihydrolipoyl dehydrogenase [Hahella ganghwensis]